MVDNDGGSSPGRPESRLSAIRERLDRTAARLRHQLEVGRQRSPGLDLAAKVADRFREANGGILAGYLAYRLVLMLLPLAVIIVAVSGFSASTTQEASTHLRLGQALASTISTAGDETKDGRIPLLVTGLFAFAYTAWGFLSALQFTSAQVWRIPTRRFPGKGKVFLRLAGSLLVFGFVLYVSALVRNAGPVAGVAGTLTSLLSSFLAFLGLGWILPRRSREWFWLLPGAVTGAIGSVALQAVGTFYIPNRLASASHTYGALGITITLLSYLYLISLFLTVAPVVTAVVWDHYEHEPPGLLRRIADRVPIPTTTFGSGYVPEGSAVDTSGPLPINRSDEDS